ncbi:hypothetical protein [Bacillus thuringiensis]|uniref:hypothetical protein n=1 Tax=Bacillus thuringiensis TaxID=1428 RepID=UPI003F5B416B
MDNQFRIGDWVVCKRNQEIFRILAFCNWKGLCVLPDNCGDWGDIERTKDCRLATKDEIKKEIVRRNKKKFIFYI